MGMGGNGNGNGFMGMGGNGNRNSPFRTPLVHSQPTTRCHIAVTPNVNTVQRRDVRQSSYNQHNVVVGDQTSPTDSDRINLLLKAAQASTLG